MLSEQHHITRAVMAAIRPAACYADAAPPITDVHVAALEADDYVVIDGLFPRIEELRVALSLSLCFLMN